MSRDHHRLLAWQKTMELVTEVYKISAVFPREDLYGLTSQIRRAAVSVPSNIAEGVARQGSKEYLHFLTVARGSLSELETQLLVARNLGYLQEDSAIFTRVEEVFALLGGLIKAIRGRVKPQDSR
ncbi:MAG: four helix bundle protein [Betaproteobacteria bacterium]|nr:four helix bundle protein [Betaproteobacteria bacterium]